MVTYERVRKLLNYNPITGVFVWNVRRGGRVAGSEAGCLKPNGYINIAVDGRAYGAHRLAWLWTHGYLSEHEIDHINRVRSDNRLVNLREVSHQCNVRNSSIRSDNSSGIQGVTYNKSDRRWHSRIDVNGVRIHIGCYKNKIEAAVARWEAENKYGFPNCNTTSTAYKFLSQHMSDAA